MVFLPPNKRWGLGQLLDSCTSLVGGKSSTDMAKAPTFPFFSIDGKRGGREVYQGSMANTLPFGQKELADVLEFLPGVFGSELTKQQSRDCRVRVEPLTSFQRPKVGGDFLMR